MNRIYRLVWDRVKGCLIVVSELAKSTGKKSTLISLLVISNASLASSQAFASDLYSEDSDAYIQITANNLAEKVSISPLEHNNPLSHVAITPFKGLIDAPDNTIVIVPGGDGSVSTIAEGTWSVAIGAGAVAKGATGGDWSSIAINGQADGKASIAFGEDSRVIGQRSIAVGNSSSVAGESSVALGADAKVDASNSAAIGNASTTDRDNTVSFGNTILRRQLINLSAGTDINDAIIVEQLTPILNALGGGASLDTLTGTVKGPQYTLNSVDAKTGSVKASTMLFTTLESALNNLSDGIKNLSNSSVRYDDAGVKGVITLGTTGNKTRLTNLADALITDTSTDAVTGGQLHAVKYDILANQNNIASNKSEIALNKANIASNSAYLSINTSNIASNTAGVMKNGANLRSVAASLGGGAQVNATGDFVGPNFSVQGKTAGNVGDAMALLDTGVSSLSSSLTSIVNNLNDGTAGLVQQDATSRAITVAQASDGTSMSIAGTEGARTLSGVKAGLLAADSSEAVNGGQLFNTNERVSKNTNDIALNTNSISTLNSMFNDLNYNISTGNVGIVKQDIFNKNISIGASAGGRYVSIAGTEGNRVLSGVNNGRISGDSVDAVNGSQLFELSQQVTKNSNDLNTLMDDVVELTSGAVGLVKADSVSNDISIGADRQGDRISVNGMNGDRILSGVADGVANNDVATIGQLREITQSSTSSFLSVNNSSNRDKPKAVGSDAIALGANASASKTNSLAVGINASANADNTVALGNNSIADRANTVSVGSEGGERQITNVAKGTQDTDAVNLGQLNETNNVINDMSSNVNREFSRLSREINRVENKLSAGVASAMAMSTMPQPYSAGTGMMALGAGTYNGQSAVAIGASRVSENGKWVTKINGSTNTKNDVGISVGVGYQW